MFGFDILHIRALYQMFSQFPQTGRGLVLLMQYSQNVINALVHLHFALARFY